MIDDPPGVVRFPGFAGLVGGVVLVEADEQIGQFTAGGLGAQQRGQFGEVYQPVGVLGGPVVVGAIDNPEHAMVGFASLVEQPADLFGGVCHLLPCGWQAGPVTSWSPACHGQGPNTPGIDPHKPSAPNPVGGKSVRCRARRGLDKYAGRTRHLPVDAVMVGSATARYADK